MAIKDSILIGQLLIDKSIITPDQLEVALQEQKRSGGFICSHLIKKGFAREEEILPILSTQLRISYVNLKEVDIKKETIEKVPAKFACHYRLMPVDFKDNALVVAVTDPLDIHTLDDIRLLLGYNVVPALSGEREILEAINRYYGVGAETLEGMVKERDLKEEEIVHAQAVEDLEALAEDASIIKFVNQILRQAIQERATDIHLEPFEDALRVRFRIDGLLYDANIPSTIKYFHQAIVSRIKILANLDIAERRLPQDGRFKIKIGEQELDLRVSILPSSFGESVQIRLLSPTFFLDLEKLGLSEENHRLLEQVIKRPHGVIFLTGPTGSGKSTTLYACLAKINSNAIKIITVEDPVEYQLKGITQIQVLPKIGLTFAAGLRTMLRHDPDVMMVGEVRDYETAEIAIRAALTGHLVFSTLHTNDAAGGITRLIDMGVEPFLVASSLECLIAQRLVRVICPHCKVRYTLPQEIVGQFDASLNVAVEAYKGNGCEICKFTGYQGRTAIHELLMMRDTLRDLVVQRASSVAIKKVALSQGMKTLRQDGWQKVLEGKTTVDEVLRVTQAEEA